MITGFLLHHDLVIIWQLVILFAPINVLLVVDSGACEWGVRLDHVCASRKECTVWSEE